MNRHQPLVTLALVVIAALLASACTEVREVEPVVGAAPCLGCHGDEAGPAPTDPLHQVHLAGSLEHPAVACETCHVVPEKVDAVGHADTKGPAEVTFRGPGAGAVYVAATATCSGVACHGARLDAPPADPQWDAGTEPSGACDVCHGKPPGGTHPQNPQCALCHGTLAAETHGNGAVELELTSSCGACHGEGEDPTPKDAFHAAHTNPTIARAVACEECHVVPATADAPGHLDPPPAEVVFSGLAKGATYAGGTCSSVSCHGDASPPPSKDDEITGQPACDSCHGAPPPLPHPPMANCSLCHAPTAGAEGIASKETHVDGTLNEAMPTACNACHGDASTNAPDLGAHKAHIDAGVGCAECHLVPSEVNAEGHIDTALPAEVVFGQVATAKGADPVWNAADRTCSGTYCHGKTEWGASLTDAPGWDATDGAAGDCGACHALPPPAPHPDETKCSDCHGTSYGTEDHVDGKTTFQ